MKANRKYKDSVFTLLFNDKKRLLELYNAVNGTSFTNEDDIEINTLQNALFMGMINDISFTIAGTLVVLVEHQSTINPNMPLRLLMYMARIYEKIIDNKRLYSSKKTIVPRPEFIVLYTGKEDFPAVKTLKLSGLFREAVRRGKAQLELEVTVYNINKGVNPAIEERSPALRGYARLVAKARENEDAGMDRSEAVKEAVSFCKARGILADFLKTHGSEVENMLLTEWKWEDALQVRWEEGKEEGREERDMVIARNALSEGASPEFVRKITGLDLQTITQLAAQ
ncbi:MAG: Rpn family recombination-promoting nuclease/putative transposase [Spirochaetaceae bacterium]|jgi:hypothetical protein|nr:Rpn family recombination-promoting nuclease/putative transposase [Spirochaetaceae bacterium]